MGIRPAQPARRFKRLDEPDVSHHGVVDTQALGAAACVGRAHEPFNVFLILPGIETLALRMGRICTNTLAVAQYLRSARRWAGLTTPGCPATPTTHWYSARWAGRPQG